MSLQPGDHAPWFTGPTPSNPAYAFDTVAGRYVLMLFLPAQPEAGLGALQALTAAKAKFDDVRLSAFVVVRNGETFAGARDTLGVRWFLDASGGISRRYGALAEDGGERPMWLLLDPTLRVLVNADLAHTDLVFSRLDTLPPPDEHAGAAMHAPVLVAPRILEPGLCEQMIALHEADGGRFTGVMRDSGDRTVAVMDELKKRRDVLVGDPVLREQILERLRRRLFPMIERALGFKVTQIERYLISRYDADEGGVFHPHRDNNTFATAHRKFACSINLNDDFEGGDLRFPEFGTQTYRPPAGGAVIFSCALLHEATRVTRGRRYAFLPFFYDDAGAEVLAAYQQRTGGPVDEPAA